jgi:DNA-binding CsgD family transcriptional regulator
MSTLSVLFTTDYRRGSPRHDSVGQIRAETLDGVGDLAPHPRRAAAIGYMLESGLAAASAFEAALDATRSGVVLVDSHSHIVHANAAARAMLDAGNLLTINAGKLRLVGELTPGQLEAAIKAAAAGEARPERRGLAIPGIRREGRPFIARVMPLGNRTALPGRAIAAVFIAGTGDDPDLEIEAVSGLYALTPTEARVFELIVKGHTSKEISAALSIAPSTLKTHTLRLFDKTGRHRRSELVRLAAEVRAPG